MSCFRCRNIQNISKENNRIVISKAEVTMAWAANEFFLRPEHCDKQQTRRRMWKAATHSAVPCCQPGPLALCHCAFSIHRASFFRLRVWFLWPFLLLTVSQSKKYIVLLRDKGWFCFSLSSTGSPISSCPPVCCSDMQNFRGLVRVQERIPVTCLMLGGLFFSPLQLPS